MNKKNIVILATSFAIGSFGYILAQDEVVILPSCEYRTIECDVDGERALETIDGVDVWVRCLEAADPQQTATTANSEEIEAISSEVQCGKKKIGHDPDNDELDFFIDVTCAGFVPDFVCDRHDEAGE